MKKILKILMRIVIGLTSLCGILVITGVIIGIITEPKAKKNEEDEEDDDYDYYDLKDF